MQTGVLVKERRLLSTFIEQYLFFVSSPLDLLLIVLFPVTNQIPLLDRRSSQNNDALNESSPYNCITSHWNNKLCFTLLDSQIRRHSYTKISSGLNFFKFVWSLTFLPLHFLLTDWISLCSGDSHTKDFLLGLKLPEIYSMAAFELPLLIMMCQKPRMAMEKGGSFADQGDQRLIWDSNICS